MDVVWDSRRHYRKTSLKADREAWGGGGFSVSLRFNFAPMPLRFLFDFILGFTSDLRLTSTSLRFQFVFTSISLRSHFDFNSIPLRFHFGLTSNSLRLHRGNWRELGEPHHNKTGLCGLLVGSEMSLQQLLVMYCGRVY